MSDFDEDAERERLREKYESDQDDRETTERMSELLLQGATMTNAHCGECGDPIFRYDGQEFCPTCEQVVGDEGGDASDTAAEADADTAAEADADTAAEVDAGAHDDAQGAPADATTDRGDADAEAAVPQAENGRPAEAADLPERRERAQVPDRDRQPRGAPRRPDPPVRREADERRREAEPAHGDDLADARDSLRRSLVRFAREAEHADDPRRAREYLEAASEAADALATLSEIR